jgi:hypothetical protein
MWSRTFDDGWVSQVAQKAYFLMLLYSIRDKPDCYVCRLPFQSVCAVLQSQAQGCGRQDLCCKAEAMLCSCCRS